MNTFYRHLVLLLPIAFICFVSQPSEQQSDEPTNNSSEEGGEYTIAPTETNWNAMMQLVYEPAFSNLKKQIGSESKEGETDFALVQRDALIISEFTSRLHQWPEIHEFESPEAKAAYLEIHKLLKTEEVHQHASSIYTAAKEKQLEHAKENFIAMTESCNACHQQKKSRWAPVTLSH